MTEMSLIEQLGGYEEAKEWYKDQDLRGNHTVRIRHALLEYRRQHNIFEIEDKVVAPISHGYFVGKIIAYRSDIDRFDVMGSRHWGWFFAHQLKHATDAEIKAGKRLEFLNESE